MQLVRLNRTKPLRFVTESREVNDSGRNQIDVQDNIIYEDRQRVKIQFETLLNTYKQDLTLDKHPVLEDVLTQLDMVAEAFELIKDGHEVQF